jgi:hypothetical protein
VRQDTTRHGVVPLPGRKYHQRVLLGGFYARLPRRYRIGMFALMMMAGCPSEFGKDGRVAKAVHQDTVNLVIKQCDDRTRRLYCDNGREHTQECIDKCG